MESTAAARGLALHTSDVLTRNRFDDELALHHPASAPTLAPTAAYDQSRST